jgi:hypothetical protein
VHRAATSVARGRSRAHGHRGEELVMQALTRWGVERALACGGGMQGMLAFKMTSRWVGGSRNSIVRGAV